MEYMLMFHSPAEDLDRRKETGEYPEYWDAWRAYIGAAYGAGIVKSGSELEGAAAASTVRERFGKRQVQDGPYAETKEVLGGFLIIDVPGIDEALHWAALSPSTRSGSTEVRPVRPVNQG